MSNVQISPIYTGGQFFTNNGAPLSGGLIYTYLSGTTNLATTYSDPAGTIPNSNPIVLNSAGRLTTEIWLVNGVQYTLALKTAAGALLNQVDGVIGTDQLVNSPYQPPVTTNGDIFIYDNGPTRLPIGTTGQVLTVAGGEPTWASPTSGGSVTSVAAAAAGAYSAAITVGGSPITSAGTLTITPNLFGSSTPGVVPGSGGDGTKALFGDGVWKTVSGGSPGGSSGALQWNSAGAFAGSNLLYSERAGGLPTLTINDPTYSGNHFTIGFQNPGGTEALVKNTATGLVLQGVNSTVDLSGDITVTTPGQLIFYTGPSAVQTGVNQYGAYVANGSVGTAGQVLTSGGAGAPAVWAAGGGGGGGSIGLPCGPIYKPVMSSFPSVAPGYSTPTTADTVTGISMVQSFPVGAANYSAVTQPIGSTTTCEMLVATVLCKDIITGIAYVESSSGKAVTFGPFGAVAGNEGHLFVKTTWTGVGATNYALIDYDTYGTYTWLRTRIVAGVIYVDLSPDGVTWVQVDGSTVISSVFNSGPDKIGLFVGSFGNAPHPVTSVFMSYKTY